MNPEEFKQLVEKVGLEAATKIKALGEDLQKKLEGQLEAIKAGAMTEQKFTDFKKTVEDSVKEIKDIAEKQGTTLQELQGIVNQKEVGNKSIAEQFEADADSLQKLRSEQTGVKTYLLGINTKGEWKLTPYQQKAAGTTGTVDGIGGGVTSISQAYSASSLIRLGADAPIVSGFRNTPWLFDLCNMINTSVDQSFFHWFDEQTKDGASNTTAEGVARPLSQYKYQLKSASYKKESAILNITDEFALDFRRIQDELTGKCRLDLYNRLNAAILANIKTAATAYDGATLAGSIQAPNNWDAIAAMAAQVENSTFVTTANAAVMKTDNKYGTGLIKDLQGRYLNPPQVLSNIAVVSNPILGADDVLVGDFKNYNIALRGAMVLRVGYNGTDFAEGKFSIVLDQYYYDYISSIRAAAIVKGPDFATVKAAINLA